MQHLLDFIHESTSEEQVYCVAPTPVGDLELLWQRQVDANRWQVRPYRCEGPWQLVHRSELLGYLERRHAQLSRLQCELDCVATAQIVLAQLLLQAADEALGRDAVRAAVRGHQEFANQLQETLARLKVTSNPPKPPMKMVLGGGAQTEQRSGHLVLV